MHRSQGPKKPENTEKRRKKLRKKNGSTTGCKDSQKTLGRASEDISAVQEWHWHSAGQKSRLSGRKNATQKVEKTHL
jgi:hypothetical protein